MKTLLFIFLLLLSVSLSADVIKGKVIKITDGDTVHVLDANHHKEKIRLAGIVPLNENNSLALKPNNSWSLRSVTSTSRYNLNWVKMINTTGEEKWVNQQLLRIDRKRN